MNVEDFVNKMRFRRLDSNKSIDESPDAYGTCNIGQHSRNRRSHTGLQFEERGIGGYYVRKTHQRN